MAANLRSDSDPASPGLQAEDSSRSYSSAFRYSFFLTLLCVVTLNQLDIDAGFSITSAVTQITTQSRVMPFHNVRSMEDAVLWLRRHLGEVLVTATFYDNTLGNFNRIISPFRMAQKRMKLKRNTSDAFVDFYPWIWKQATLEMFRASDCEDHDAYGPLDVFRYDPHFGARNEGGFGFALSPFSAEDLTNELLIIYDWKFVDRQTATFYLDFVLYNGHVDMLTYVTMRFQGDQSGCVGAEIQVQPVKSEPYKSARDYMRAVGEILYVILTLVFAGIELYTFKVFFAARKLQLRSEQMQKKWVIAFRGALSDYFSDTWRYVDVACITISWVSIALWLSLVTRPFTTSAVSELDWTLLNEVMEKATLMRIYLRVNAVNFFLAFIHLIKYLEVFKRIALLRQSLQRAGGDIAYFGALVSAVIISFVICSHIALGTIQEHFSTFPKAFMECILIVFRGFEGVKQAWHKERVWTAAFFFPYTILVMVIFLNMFIAILSGSYKTCLDDMERTKTHTLKDHIFVRSRRSLKKWLEKIKLLFRKPSLNLKMLRSADSVKKAVTFGAQLDPTEISALPQATESVLLQFGFNDSFLDKKPSYDLHDFDSARRREFEMSVVRKRKAREMIAALSYLCFIALMIAVLLWQQEIDLCFSLSESVKQGFDRISYNLRFEEVAEFGGVFWWLYQSRDLYQVSSNREYYMNEKLYLVNQTLRFTVRKIELESNPSSLFSRYVPKIRIGSGFEPDAKGEHEDKDTFRLTKRTLSYSEGGGFRNAGGFVLLSTPDSFRNDLIEISSTFTDSLNSIVVESVLYSANADYFIHIAQVFRFLSGGRIAKQLRISPVRMHSYSSDSDKARAAFEVLFCMLLVVMIYSFLHRFKAQWETYSVWQRELYAALNPTQIRKRNKVKPEWIRRMKVVFHPLCILELAGYIFAIVSIGLWVAQVVLSESSLTDPYSVVGAYESVHDAYLCTTSTCCLFLSLQLLNYFRLNSSLGVLQRTLSRAARDTLYYLIMFVTFWTAFAFLAYLAFGMQLEHYSTLANSYMFCFQMMTRNYNYTELKETDEIIAPLFFVFFMVFFVCVILNIFIVILERAYTSVTDSIRQNPEIEVSLWKSLMAVFRLRMCAKKKTETDHAIKLQPDTSYKLMDLSLSMFPTHQLWADTASSQILAERTERNRLSDELSLAAKRKSQRKMTQQTQSKLECAYRERYWEYLRGAHQMISKQTRVAGEDKDAVQRKAEQLEEQLEQINATSKDLMSQIGAIERELVELSGELPKVEERLKEQFAKVQDSDEECLPDE